MSPEAISIGPFSEGLVSGNGYGELNKLESTIALENLEVMEDGSLVNRPMLIRHIPNTSITGTEDLIPLGTIHWDNKVLIAVKGFNGDSVNNTFVGVMDTSELISAPSTVQNVKGDGIVSTTSESVGPGVQFGALFYTFFAGGGGVASINPSTGAVSTSPSLPGMGLLSPHSCAVYKNRVFVGGTSSTSQDAPGRLFYSNIGTTSSSSSNYIDIGGRDGQSITALIPLGDDLVIFKNHSVYRLTYASDIARAEVTLVSTKYGASFIDENQRNSVPPAVIDDQGSIFFNYMGRVYEMYNYQITPLSLPVEYGRHYPIGLWRVNDRIFVQSATTTVAGDSRKVLVFNLRTRTWSMWTLPHGFRGAVSGSAKVMKTEPHDASRKVHEAIGVVFRERRAPGLEFFTYKELPLRSSNWDADSRPFIEDLVCTFTTPMMTLNSLAETKTLFWWGLGLTTRAESVEMVLRIPREDGSILEETSVIPINTSLTPPITSVPRFIRSLTSKHKFRQIQFKVTITIPKEFSTFVNLPGTRTSLKISNLYAGIRDSTATTSREASP